MSQIFVRAFGTVASRGLTVRARCCLRSKIGATRDVAVRSAWIWSVRRAGQASAVPSKAKNQHRTKREANMRKRQPWSPKYEKLLRFMLTLRLTLSTSAPGAHRVSKAVKFL